MHVLLDTHLLLWWLTNDSQLSKKARTLIDDAENIYISSASIWEIATKIRLEKLKVELGLLLNSIDNEGFIELPITAKHAAATSELPLYHRDPFDRMLIAQCISEPLRFLTADKTLKKYSELIEVV